MEVKSVYNFVPAPIEDDVFKPDWAEQVSHDIPFSDGESGEIEFTITSKTPIFIRNGHTKRDKEIYEKYRDGKLPNPTQKEKEAIERYLSFSHVYRNGNKQFFIPATSIKGMIRNVLEIITRSRLSQIDNHRHAVRQIMRTQGTVVDEGYTLKDHKKEIYAGWLIYKDGKHYIYNAGKPYKIRYTDLDKKLGTKFWENFKQGGIANIYKKFENRTAKYKYQNLLNGKRLVHIFEEPPLDEDEKQKNWVNNVRFATKRTEATFYGHIVCTGQSAEYNQDNSRKGEYVFKGQKETLLNNKKKELVVPDEVFDNFLFINRHNKHDELEDWTYFKNKLDEGIPVFFRKAKNKKEVLDFGLTFMYKEPVKNSTHQLSPYKSYEFEKLDLVETILGSSQKELKGRVFFSHAFTIGIPREMSKEDIVLSTPHSSYFPYYLKQDNEAGTVSKYNTYNTENSELSGFKRYYVRKNLLQREKRAKGTSKMISSFKPLKEYTKFKAKIRFHNLRTVEIGALLSALTFHNFDNAYHLLGSAKPYSFGKVKIKIEKTKYLKKDYREYMKYFENEVVKNFDNWTMHKIINMAIENNDKNLVYPDLSEFQEMKNTGKYLPQIVINKKVESLPYVGYWEDKKREEEQKRLAEEMKQQKEKDKFENKIKNILKNYDEVYEGDEILAYVEKTDTKRCFIIHKNKIEDVQLVINIKNKGKKIPDKSIISVRIKQTKKDGTINQVELIEIKR